MTNKYDHLNIQKTNSPQENADEHSRVINKCTATRAELKLQMKRPEEVLLVSYYVSFLPFCLDVFQKMTSTHPCSTYKSTSILVGQQENVMTDETMYSKP